MYSFPEHASHKIWEATHGVLEGFEQELVCKEVHCQLLISKSVHAVGSTA